MLSIGGSVGLMHNLSSSDNKGPAAETRGLLVEELMNNFER
jgi:hypothetical protein